MMPVVCVPLRRECVSRFSAMEVVSLVGLEAKPFRQREHRTRNEAAGEIRVLTQPSVTDKGWLAPTRTRDGSKRMTRKISTRSGARGDEIQPTRGKPGMGGGGNHIRGRRTGHPQGAGAADRLHTHPSGEAHRCRPHPPKINAFERLADPHPVFTETRMPWDALFTHIRLI